MLNDQPIGTVDATGALRRLQALIAMGHPPIPLAAHLAMTVEELWELLGSKGARVRLDIREAAEELFDSLWDLRIEGPLGDQMRQLARERRWVGPLAWDDIDDPNEKPNLRGLVPVGSANDDPAEVISAIDSIALERAIRGEHVKLTRAERLLAVARLHSRRLSDKVIARTIHVSDKTVLRARQALGLEAIDPIEIREAETA